MIIFWKPLFLVNPTDQTPCCATALEISHKKRGLKYQEANQEQQGWNTTPILPSSPCFLCLGSLPTVAPGLSCRYVMILLSLSAYST